jgi:hypothetical protein
VIAAQPAMNDHEFSRLAQRLEELLSGSKRVG